MFNQLHFRINSAVGVTSALSATFYGESNSDLPSSFSTISVTEIRVPCPPYGNAYFLNSAVSNFTVIYTSSGVTVTINEFYSPNSLPVGESNYKFSNLSTKYSMYNDGRRFSSNLYFEFYTSNVPQQPSHIRSCLRFFTNCKIH